MKIRTKLTLKYLGLTAVVFSVFVLIIYIFSSVNREREFYRDLTSEAVTKANLFLSGRADAVTMQTIYLNNREFIDEVEVAVYTTGFELLYHDAQDIDIVKETPELIERTVGEEKLNFYEGRYQVVSMLYEYAGTPYVITAAAYDGYGYSKLRMLKILLAVLWASGLVILAVLGYFLARSALAPVSRIVDEVETITGPDLNTRLEVKDANDELGELSVTFNNMLGRLEKSFSGQKMFVSNISHELRTPLAALIAELELALIKDRTSEQYRSAIVACLSDARKLEKLSSGLLDLAKADYDSGNISMHDIRLDELVLDAREVVMKANPGYHVEIFFEQDSDDESLVTVSGNEYLLRTAFVNLIENNCKFSDDHTSNVSISYYGSNAVLRFSDTGCGIPEEDLDHVFTPFYRGGNSSSISGHGIGLALVAKIILIHDGTIQARSAVGEGTDFVCELPHL